jgi:hypothetical protein
MEYLGPVLEFLLPVLGTILTIVAAALAKKYIGKLGVERSEKVDAMIDKYVGIGVDAAKKVAANYLAANGQKLPGGSKKAKAVSTVLSELEQSGIKGVAEELISARIEAWLENKEPGKSPGAESTPA